MSDRPGEDVPAEAAQTWDSVRRVREPIAWLLLVITAIAVIVSAWQLFGLPGAGLPSAPVATRATHGFAPVPGTTFGFRAAVVAAQFVAGAILTWPVLAVILVAFAGGPTNRARLVVQTAVSIQAVAIGLAVLSWVGALGGHLRPGAWFIFDALELAAVAAVIFGVAVLRSQALRPPTPEFEDFGEGDEDFDP